ncbi:Fe-S cluster assembly protein SufD [Paenibacillus sp. MSJ-34]|uniref:Fe-S cluster assembly protein SufD n=1 Tax=Paenibacillus sp. MSJ-34 TaxID=2841529 RepID=UPI001C10FAC2|nr:Fe-S cluster assembly protein SufD [Paenibacillus sp. MSJ-34]MBU5445019.1 Fe-S cluster assembly protein SufD [Paenibacillus sp. MSJ-34]
MTMNSAENRGPEQLRYEAEPDWLTELRKRGLDAARTLQLPKLDKTKLQRWPLGQQGVCRKPEPASSLDELPDSIRRWVYADDVLVQRNSGPIIKHLTEALQKQGIILTDLETATRLYPELVKPYFMQALHTEENLLTAQHAARWSGGAFIYIPEGVHVETPLQTIFFVDESDTLFMPHVLVVAEERSSVTLVENTMSSLENSVGVNQAVMEVFVGKGAQVNVVSLHQLERDLIDLTYRRAIVEQGGTMNWLIGEMNGGKTMSDTASLLKGEGAGSDLKTILVGSGSQTMNITARTMHFGKNSTSDMVIRAVMREQSTAILNGITKIEKGASGANGQQTEKILMLHPGARGDANPILLIDEDDVKAGHAASVGQVNPEQLYYMMSRGISRVEAERLIVYGFLAPVVAEVPLEGIAAQMQALVEQKLGQVKEIDQASIVE